MEYVRKIEKESLRTLIRTTSETIEGMVYKRPKTRLLDTLNLENDQFIAVSDAKVYSDEDGKLVYEAEFMAVNKKHIILMTGDEVKVHG